MRCLIVLVNARLRLLIPAEPRFICTRIFIRNRKESLRAVRNVTHGVTVPRPCSQFRCADSRFVIAHPMADLEADHAMLALRELEFESTDEIVRRVLIVVEHEMTANRRNLGREADPECPTGHVELMHALVAEVPIPIREVPVPVVVEAVLRKGLHRSRTGPQ